MAYRGDVVVRGRTSFIRSGGQRVEDLQLWAFWNLKEFGAYVLTMGDLIIEE